MSPRSAEMEMSEPMWSALQEQRRSEPAHEKGMRRDATIRVLYLRQTFQTLQRHEETFSFVRKRAAQHEVR